MCEHIIVVESDFFIVDQDIFTIGIKSTKIFSRDYNQVPHTNFLYPFDIRVSFINNHTHFWSHPSFPVYRWVCKHFQVKSHMRSKFVRIILHVALIVCNYVTSLHVTQSTITQLAMRLQSITSISPHERQEFKKFQQSQEFIFDLITSTSF